MFHGMKDFVIDVKMVLHQVQKVDPYTEINQKLVDLYWEHGERITVTYEEGSMLVGDLLFTLHCKNGAKITCKETFYEEDAEDSPEFFYWTLFCGIMSCLDRLRTCLHYLECERALVN